MRKLSVVWLGLVLVVLFALLIPLNQTVVADNLSPQTATPLPSPMNNGGSAGWTVASNTFKSNFPNGFTFSLDAESSAGDITTAIIIWRHSPSRLFRDVGTINRKTGKISFKWDDGFLPQWVGVEYWWVLTDDSGNTFETEHQYDEYADDNRDWNRTESEDIIVFWEKGLPKTLGDRVIKALRDRREFYLEKWGTLLNYRPRVIIYKGETAWLEWNPYKDESILGQTSGEWGGTIQYYRGSGNEIANIVAPHEVAHLYQEANGGLWHSRVWFYEGNATYFELNQMYDYIDHARELAANGDLPSLLDDSLNYDDREAYDVGYAFWVWLEETHGEDAHLKIWTQVGHGVSPIVAIEQVVGQDFVEIETDFRRWLGMDDPVPPTKVPLPTINFPPTRDYNKKPTKQP